MGSAWKSFCTRCYTCQSKPACKSAIREWIALIPREKRKEIVEAVFQILDAAGIETVDDFLTLKLKDIRTIIQTKKKLPRETSDSISDAAFLLIKIMIKTFTST